MKKDPWIPIYRDKEKKNPAWATLDGSDVIENGRNENQGPSNGVYHMANGVRVIPISETYRNRYDLIDWDNDDNKTYSGPTKDPEDEFKNVVGFI